MWGTIAGIAASAFMANQQQQQQQQMAQQQGQASAWDNLAGQYQNQDMMNQMSQMQPQNTPEDPTNASPWVGAHLGGQGQGQQQQSSPWMGF